ncbi:MAG: CPBP family glutamic-type intramembrane protease [Marinicellaceae bacterium]
MSWVLVLELTKQRVELEGVSKLNTYLSIESPYVWNFEADMTDIVTPYQKYWTVQESINGIQSKTGESPELSLNFSGEKVNALHFNRLKLKSSQLLSGQLKLQIKVSHDDSVFYYSKNIGLKGKQQIIDLDTDWLAIDSQSNQSHDFRWPGSQNQISSLILQFDDLKSAVQLDSVVLLMNERGLIPVDQKIDCHGIYKPDLEVSAAALYVFQLSESCWLPSNYMWVKKVINDNFPGSVLRVENTQLLIESKPHKVNENYANIIPINIIFYLLIVIFILIVFFICKKNSREKQIFYQNKIADFKNSYAVILGLSLTALGFMSLFQLPNYSTFKMFPFYFLWAILQQIILGYVLADKVFFKRTNNQWLSALLAAAVFAVFHLPSMVLFLATFFAGLLWSYGYLKYRRIMPLALSHTILALMFYHIVPNHLLYSARVFQWFWE